MSSDIKETLAKAVVAVTSAKKGKKSSGTIIATIVKDIAIVSVEPFSL